MRNIVLGVLLLFFSSICFCQPGSLVDNFGNKGLVLSDFPGSDLNSGFTVTDILNLPNGDVLVIFSSYYYTVLAKRKPNGQPDLSFGRNGFSEIINIAQGRAGVLKDGRLLLSGLERNIQWNKPAFVCLTKNGMIDRTFGDDGILVSDAIPSLAYSSNDLVKLSDGSLLAYYRQYNNNAVHFAKITAEGRLDPGFGSSGWVTDEIPGNYNLAPIFVHPLPDGRFLLTATGYTGSAPGTQAIVVKFTSKASKDLSFGNNGIAEVSLPTLNSFLVSSHVDPAGQIKLVVEQTEYSQSGRLVFFYLNPNGSMNTNWYGSGVRFVDPGAMGGIQIGFHQTDGKLVLVTGEQVDGEAKTLVRRFKVNGDQEFGLNGNGAGLSYLPGNFNVQEVFVSGSGNMFFAGGMPSKCPVAVLKPSGEPENLFDKDGYVEVFYRSPYLSWRFSARLDKSNYLLLGTTSSPSGDKMVLSRFNAYGRQDMRFGKNGFVSVKLSVDDFTPTDLYVQNSKIIIGGTATINFIRYYFIARLDASGNFDKTFNGCGYLLTNLGKGIYTDGRIFLQKDGKVLLGGSFFKEEPNEDYYNLCDLIMVRYQQNGKLDSKFGRNGSVFLDYNRLDNICMGFAESQEDGFYVAVSAGGFGYTPMIGIHKFSGNGRRDRHFGTEGVSTINLGMPNVNLVKDVLVDPDGRILVAGMTGSSEYDGSMGVTRILKNGSLDPGFGSNGNVLILSDQGYIYSGVNALQRHADGSIYLIGYKGVPQGYGALPQVVKVNKNGQLDKHFSIDPEISKFQGKFNDALIVDDKLICVGNYSTIGELGIQAALAIGMNQCKDIKVFVDRIKVTEVDNGFSKAIFKVRLDRPAEEAIRINYKTISNSAVCPADFSHAEGTVYFPLGCSEQTITVWIKGDIQPEPIEKFNLHLTVPYNSGSYQVTASCEILDNDNCLPESSSVLAGSMETDIVIKENVAVYPIPANQQVNIRLPFVKDDVQCLIYDQSGKLLHASGLKGNVTAINTAAFPSGTYELMLIRDKSTIFRRRILVQH